MFVDFVILYIVCKISFSVTPPYRGEGILATVVKFIYYI